MFVYLKFNIMKKLLLYLCIGMLTSYTSHATVYNCSSVQDILDALIAVSAGDEIVIAAGTYTTDNSDNGAYYYSNAEGTASNPIMIRSASSSNKAVLKGNSISSKAVLRIEGNYWIVKDLEITVGQKGLVFDNSNYSKAINCKIHNFGNEAVHVRDGSDHVTIDNCTIYNTGNVNPGFGEGVYIGTDKGSWSSYNQYVDYTTVKNCTIGPDIRAEAFDIKEGTKETVVEGNTIDGKGISGQNFADSFIDLKGTRTYVRNNTFNQNGEAEITKGIAVTDRGVELSSYEHVIHGNTFNMDSGSDYILEAYSGTSEVYAVNNTRNPAGDMYNSSIIDESCPSWYAAGCSTTPTNQVPTVSITSPTSGSSFVTGNNIIITASANDSDGNVTKVEFYNDNTKLGEDTSNPYEYTISNASAGNYVITAKATDNDGATQTSTAVNFTITDPTSGGGITIESVDAEQAPNVAENLLDGNNADASRWSASGFPKSVVIDYGENKSITGTKIWTYQNRAYQYKIEASTSPTSGFSQIVDRTGNTSTAQPITNDFNAVTARYIKITVTGASGYSGSWVSLTEFEIVEGSGVVSVTGVSLSPNSNTISEGQSMQLTATVSPSNATNKSVSYSSNDTSTITVSSSGLVSAISAGSTTITVTTIDGGFTSSANISVTGGGTTCNFGTPASGALQVYDDATFVNVHILGTGGPSLSNLSKFRINWIPSDNNLKRFAINTTDGSPSYYNDLRTSMIYDFNSSNPDALISSSGFAGLDGDYWVTNDGNNFVMVSKGGGFTLYFSNSSSPPSCSNARFAQGKITPSVDALPLSVYPNPSTTGRFILNNEKEWTIISLDGAQVLSGSGKDVNLAGMSKGIYILNAEGVSKRLIIK
jgi:uncharacterized protein YjdB